jgi:hypothetical protein
MARLAPEVNVRLAMKLYKGYEIFRGVMGSGEK